MLQKYGASAWAPARNNARPLPCAGVRAPGRWPCSLRWALTHRAPRAQRARGVRRGGRNQSPTLKNKNRIYFQAVLKKFLIVVKTCTKCTILSISQRALRPRYTHSHCSNLPSLVFTRLFLIQMLAEIHAWGGERGACRCFCLPTSTPDGGAWVLTHSVRGPYPLRASASSPPVCRSPASLRGGRTMHPTSSLLKSLSVSRDQPEALGVGVPGRGFHLSPDHPARRRRRLLSPLSSALPHPGGGDQQPPGREESRVFPWGCPRAS